MASTATITRSALIALLLLTPSPATAQVVAGQSLQGDWVRVDSNNDPNDRMRIRIDPNGALLTAVPPTVGRSFTVGLALWRGIQSDGSLQVRGSDGNYYPARLTFQGPDVVHIDIQHTGAGNDQTWSRAGPSIDGDWVRIAAPGVPDDGVQVRVAGSQASVRYLPASAPRSLRVGTQLWQSIGAGSTLQVMGGDGKYYTATYTLVGTDRVRIDSSSPQVGSGQIWVRPGAVNAARAALAGAVNNPNTPGASLTPPSNLPTAPSPGSSLPPGATGACIASSVRLDQMGVPWGLGLSSSASNGAQEETLGIRDYMISGFSGSLRQQNELTDLERARIPGLGPGFAYVWQPRSRSWIERRDLTSAEFDQESQTQRTAGSRLSDFEAYLTPAGMRYAGVWVANAEGIGWRFDYDMTATEYGNARRSSMASGYRLVDLEGYEVPGGIRWAALWYRSCDNTDWHEIRGLDRTAYQQRVDSLASLGYRVIDFESYETPGGQRYAAIWQKIPPSRAWAVRSDRTLKWFLNYHRQYEDEGLRLIDFESYDTANGIRYAGVWAENDARYDMPFKTALTDSLRTYRSTHRIPGMSVVVMQNGEVIYRRGFGWADSVDAKTANSGTVYLTASIAKAIGATIAARLEEQGRIDLTRRTSDFLTNLPSHHTHTLEQLLAKIGCVWHYPEGPEPVEQTYQWRDSALAQIWNSPLLSGCVPGRQYHYSTHGFTFVGGVLEATLGKDIARIVDDELTRPFALTSMRTVAPLVSFGSIGGTWVPRYDLAQGYHFIAPALISRRNTTRPGMTGRSDPRDYEDSSWKVLGGGLQTNALDLARFGWLTLNGSIVSDSVRDNRLWRSLTDTTTAWLSGTVVPSVGLAWVLRNVCTGPFDAFLRCSMPTRRVAGHGGVARGARSQLQVYRDDELVIAILTNQRNTPITCPSSTTPGDCAHPIRGLADQVARIVFRDPPPP